MAGDGGVQPGIVGSELDVRLAQALRELDRVVFDPRPVPFVEGGIRDFAPATSAVLADRFRCADTACDLAFLTMDLRYRERPSLAEWLLATYALETDDYGLFPLVDVFATYRALVRAKVAALAAGQPSIEAAQRKSARESALRHLTLAEGCLETRASGELILLCGTVGCGKSTVARARARDDGDIPIASDRVRKILAGLAPTEPAPAEEIIEGSG